jgi:hypothetical protein
MTCVSVRAVSASSRLISILIEALLLVGWLVTVGARFHPCALTVWCPPSVRLRPRCTADCGSPRKATQGPRWHSLGACGTVRCMDPTTEPGELVAVTQRPIENGFAVYSLNRLDGENGPADFVGGDKESETHFLGDVRIRCPHCPTVKWVGIYVEMSLGLVPVADCTARCRDCEHEWPLLLSSKLQVRRVKR